MYKHTPGPWRAIGAAVHAPCRHADSQRIADCRALLPDAELHANAALIAAAPDLLDALHRILRHIPADEGGASMSDDIWRAQMAIKKALGKA